MASPADPRSRRKAGWESQGPAAAAPRAPGLHPKATSVARVHVAVAKWACQRAWGESEPGDGPPWATIGQKRQGEEPVRKRARTTSTKKSLIGPRNPIFRRERAPSRIQREPAVSSRAVLRWEPVSELPPRCVSKRRHQPSCLPAGVILAAPLLPRRQRRARSTAWARCLRARWLEDAERSQGSRRSRITPALAWRPQSSRQAARRPQP